MLTLCRKISLAWTIILALSLFPDFLIAQDETSPSLGRTQISAADSEFASLSLDEKVGHLLMIGFPQSELDQKLQAHILKIKSSSFIFFKRNIQSLGQVARFNFSLRTFVKKNLKADALIAVDQEGGLVARLQTKPQMPNAFSVGLTRDSDIAHDLGVETGVILNRYGFNMNLAPVLDLTDLNLNTFIGLRSFSSVPEIASQMTSQYSAGLIESGVLPTAKHFPGMTLISQDPHQGLVVSTRTADELRSVDLLPYQEFIGLGPNTAIMLSHLVYPALDKSKTPAIFSHKITHDLLRDEMKFEGLVITDDIQMKSSAQVASSSANAIASLKAGADILIFSWSFRDQEQVFNDIKSAIQSGELSADLINVKVKRILAIKKFYAIKNTILPPLDEKVLASPVLADLDEKITTSHVQNMANQLRSLSADKSVCVYSSNKNFISSFQHEGIKNVKYYTLNAQIRPQELSKHLTLNKCSLNMISVFGKNSAFVLSQIKNKELINRTLVINFSHPSVVSGLWPKSLTFDFGFPHQETGKNVALTLQRIRTERSVSNVGDENTKKGTSDEPALDQPAYEPPPVERNPSERRLKTQ